ncbi:MAG: hypothetical protein LBM02_08800 [Lachnospiraceae bacterium]|jgi:hypothetical protein|nr:hypothetical protein [Lachnospiraceae bacterium]
MSKFKEEIKKRVFGFRIVIAILLVAYIIQRYLGYRYAASSHVYDFISGTFFGMEVAVCFYTVRLTAILRNEEKLNALYLKEHDERNIYIQNKMGKLPLFIVMIGLYISGLIACVFSQTVCFTLMAAMMFTCLVALTLKIYYHHKI